MSTLFLNFRMAKFILFFLDGMILFTGLSLPGLFSSQFTGLLTGICLTSLYSFRCFDFTDHNSPASIASACIGALILSLPVCFFFLVFFDEPFRGTSAFGVFLVFFAVLPLLHSAFSVLLLRFLPRERVLVLGDLSWEPIFREISERTKEKIHPETFIPAETGRLASWLRDHPEATGVVLTDPGSMKDPNLAGLLEERMKRGFQVKYLCEIAEFTLQRIPLSILQAFGGYYDISLRTRSPLAYSRARDILLAAFLSVLFLPVMLLIAGGIALTMGFPLFYSQPRVGRNGSVFTLRKFRTMKETDGKAPSFAGDNMDRITPLGRFFRKTRLDELPQLWNVLKGEMSLIGPRPEQVEFDRRYEREIPFYFLRSRLRPGITGWAQINDAYASNREETVRKLEYDLFYVKNASPLLDLEIALKTVQIMLGMRGSK